VPHHGVRTADFSEKITAKVKTAMSLIGFDRRGPDRPQNLNPVDPDVNAFLLWRQVRASAPDLVPPRGEMR
jgi:hypothetical protein